MKDIISIIVPIYNVEKYLNKCIDSLISQSYKNIEIILVDDGSTDNCPMICDNYAKRDNRIITFHKKNGGLSDARNFGLSKAKGEYISFIDSDDYIDYDMIEKLYQGCINNNVKISCCGKYKEYSNSKVVIANTSAKPFMFTKTEALKCMLLMNKIDTTAFDKLYKRELFDDIEFPKSRYYEDLATIYKVINKTDGVYHIGEAKYHYVIRDNSILTSKFNIKHMDSVYFAEIICDFFKKDGELFECAKSYYYLTLCTILQEFYNKKAINEFKLLYKEVRKKFRNNLFEALKCKFIPFKKKIMMVLVYLKLYKTVNFFKRFR